MLHNVGNVLNSVNISSSLLADGLRKSRASDLARAVLLMKEHKNDLGTFITLDFARPIFAGYHLARSFPNIWDEVSERPPPMSWVCCGRTSNTSRKSWPCSRITPLLAGSRNSSMFWTWWRTARCDGALSKWFGVRYSVEVVRDFAQVPAVNIEKHKVLQILVNLLSNAAKHVLSGNQREWTKG